MAEKKSSYGENPRRIVIYVNEEQYKTITKEIVENKELWSNRDRFDHDIDPKRHPRPAHGPMCKEVLLGYCLERRKKRRNTK